MKLTGVIAEGTFQQLLEKAKPGNSILLCETEKWGDWHADPRGVVIEYGKKTLLNNETETKWEPPDPSSDVVMEWDKGGKNQLLLNGEKVLYEGPYDGYDYHSPSGTLVIRIGNRFFMVVYQK